MSYEPQNLEVIRFLQERCTILYTLLAFVQFSELVQMVDIFGVDINLQNFRLCQKFHLHPFLSGPQWSRLEKQRSPLAYIMLIFVKYEGQIS